MNRTFKPNRQGITLLFVISMIVLFLLMGTAFVIVANDFNRASTSRIRSNLPEGKGTQQSNQLLEEAMLQIIRGPSLDNIDSPLRVNDILSDQYGFGRKAYVAENPQLVSGGVFLEITLKSDPAKDVTEPDGAGIELLRPTMTRPFSPEAIDNSFGGRVLSFTSGPAKGFSARIYTDFFNGDDDHVFRIPTASVTGDIITSDTVDDLFNSEVIINGRDFSGTGADVIFTGVTPTSLGTEAALPNRVGQLHSDLIDSYLIRTVSGTPEAWETGINEPWDAADIATMFLSGYDKNGQLIPSFFREANTTADSAGGSATFHAFDEANDSMPDVDSDGDGTPDSFWMDLGTSIVTNRNGQRFKPLFAIHIRDMDGLLNVNAHSNLTHLQTDGFVNEPPSWVGTSPLGSGMGPADINLTDVAGGNLKELLDARYGLDLLPGNGLNSFRSRAKLFGYPDNTIDPGLGIIGGLFGSPMDIYGRFRTGSPTTTGFTDPNFPAFNNGLPQINMLTTQDLPKPGDPGAFTDEFSGNPYEMSLSGKVTGDTPFTAEELEKLLRPNDLDSSVLPDRLSEILDGSGSGLLTTDSNDVPMLHRDFIEELITNISLRNTALNSTSITTLIRTLTNPDGQFAFAPELFRGLKMDINRPFGNGRDDNNNDVIDEPTLETAINNEENEDAEDVLGSGETAMSLTYGKTSAGTPRELYARHLYMLAMLLLEPVDMNDDGTADPAEFAKAMAQWAVNVVDFRDADSIHTRFEYDPTPWNARGWSPRTDDSGGPLAQAAIPVVWGAERPELLLTETLAVHIQNMKNTETDDTKPPVYEQGLRPEPFAYFEVYNPWTQNSLNQRLPAELYDTGPGVILGKTSLAGNSPVWRFAVERAVTPANANDPTEYKPLRYVYMTNPGNAISYDDDPENLIVKDDIEIFFSSGTTALVRPGQQALIGTKGFADPDDADSRRVFMGRKTTTDDTTQTADELNEELNATTRIALKEGAAGNLGTVTRYTGNGGGNVRNTSVVFIDQSVPAAGGTAEDRKFSLSDSFGGYTDVDSDGDPMVEISDGFRYTKPYMTTLDVADNGRTADEVNLLIRSKDGIHKNFRYVRLQRLANPLIAWDVVTNPYLTIDSMEVDLISINGADEEDASRPGAAQTQAVSHERGDSTDADSARAELWGFQREAIRMPMGGSPSADHHYALEFDESLGRTNDLFEPETAGNPFPWLTWNNRPFISHMEIMNVPYLAPDRLTYSPETDTTQPFTVGDAPLTDADDTTISDPYTETRPGALAGRYGHLLNFFAGEDDSTSTTNQFSDVYKLLDFIEVPSRFVNNESYYLTSSLGNSDPAFRHPFNTISRYRVPGKININTIPPTTAGDSTSSAVWDALIADQVTWATLKNSIYGTAATPAGETDFENPVRPAGWANLVPGAANQITSPSACTLMRPVDADSSPQTPLFDYTNSTSADDSNRSAAFQNSIRTRLGNLVTNKSSVFACWITVGYFEVDENDAVVQTAEVGIDTGEQVRNRAFFIFDRSIPVAFEPGKNHNVEDAILTKSLQINF